jgi:uncharacterized membrane protein YadS
MPSDIATENASNKTHFNKAIFAIGFIISASGLISPPVALTLGILYGLSFAHPFKAESREFSRFLLQSSVVALGFGMNLHEVLKAGLSGFVYTALGISFALVAGLGLGKLLKVPGKSAFLITAGTAICGGSAIAAIGPILQAGEEEMAVSLGTVFILNSVALMIFPVIGWALHLNETQFGLWAALAIHDTSSVVGATAKYGSSALLVGTTVKLARALWIVPLALATAAFKRNSQRNQIVQGGSQSNCTSSRSAETQASNSGVVGRATNHASSRPYANEFAINAPGSRSHLPWFILFFCLAVVINTYIRNYAPSIAQLAPSIFGLGRLGLTATLFLIGTGISRATLRSVGWRPLFHGVLLWTAVGLTSLYFIRTGLIGF